MIPLIDSPTLIKHVLSAQNLSLNNPLHKRNTPRSLLVRDLHRFFEESRSCRGKKLSCWSRSPLARDTNSTRARFYQAFFLVRKIFQLSRNSLPVTARAALLRASTMASNSKAPPTYRLPISIKDLGHACTCGWEVFIKHALPTNEMRRFRSCVLLPPGPSSCSRRHSHDCHSRIHSPQNLESDQR